MTEPFTQWVIEDHFASGRPAFELAGAQMVEDVEAYELMKLRMLNGSHSTMAYLGYLAGYQYVNEAIADPAIHALVHGLMTNEAMPTLPMDRADLDNYRDQLLARFANPALKHRTWQIAMDGSQKLPQRLLGTVRDHIEAGTDYSRCALGVAAWMRYVTGIDEEGQPIEVKDPFAARFKTASDASGRDPAKLADALLAISEIFGTDLPADTQFRATIVAHLKSLFDRGALATTEAVIKR
jgi:fructuronate reductase